jgi:hypothetical protein
MFKLNTRERLSLWKSFRNDIGRLSIEEALNKTLSFWQSCPFVPYYLNYHDSSNWPDPWQLIEENCYCDIAKVLGIVYTLHLSDHGSNLNPEIRVYYDANSSHQYHIAYLCHGKYVLNLIDGQVVNKEHINQSFRLICCYTAKDLQLEKY